MLGDSKATSEQSSSVHENAGYDEIYPSGREQVEDLTWSPERKPSTHSLAEEEEEEEYEEEGWEEDKEEEDEGKEEGDGDEVEHGKGDEAIG